VIKYMIAALLIIAAAPSARAQLWGVNFEAWDFPNGVSDPEVKKAAQVAPPGDLARLSFDIASIETSKGVYTFDASHQARRDVAIKNGNPIVLTCLGVSKYWDTYTDVHGNTHPAFPQSPGAQADWAQYCDASVTFVGAANLYAVAIGNEWNNPLNVPGISCLRSNGCTNIAKPDAKAVAALTNTAMQLLRKDFPGLKIAAGSSNGVFFGEWIDLLIQSRMDKPDYWDTHTYATDNTGLYHIKQSLSTMIKKKIVPSPFLETEIYGAAANGSAAYPAWYEANVMPLWRAWPGGLGGRIVFTLEGWGIFKSEGLLDPNGTLSAIGTAYLALRGL
jgi:hypothetical protein